MVEKTLDELVQDLRQRRRLGELPPVLLLGAGASVESGIGAMTDLFKLVRRDTFEQFCDYVRPLTPAERYRLLANFLQTQQPAEMTLGYRALAALCEEAYLDVVLTTNVDPLLDDALAGARLWRRDYIVLVNGVVRADRVDVLLAAVRPRVKVLKLHGDLFCRFMAWTPAEMDEWVTAIGAPVAHAIKGRDVLVVGHSLRDEKVRDLVLGTDGAVWYVTPASVPNALGTCDRVRAIVGPDSTFEGLFGRLARGLELWPAPAPAPAAATRSAEASAVIPRVPAGRRTRHADADVAVTVDDVMSAVVRVESPDGQSMMTGFVLAEPRVIVTDGWAGGTVRADRRLVAIGDGSPAEVRVLHQFSEHPFGPLLLEVPEAFSGPALALDPEPCPAGLPVRIVAAAGARRGLSEGRIAIGRQEEREVAPLGRVPALVRVDGRVAPGAYGAPVLDDAMCARGFVVRGGGDGPSFFMYPSTFWGGAAQARIRSRRS
jgi:hypothetical protein